MKFSGDGQGVPWGLTSGRDERTFSSLPVFARSCLDCVCDALIAGAILPSHGTSLLSLLTIDTAASLLQRGHGYGSECRQRPDGPRDVEGSTQGDERHTRSR